MESPHNRRVMVLFTIALAIWVILMSKLCKPTFEKKDHGRGAGIPVLKTIWDLFDLSLLFSQSGIRKKFLLWLIDQGFDWVTKAKSYTIL